MANVLNCCVIFLQVWKQQKAEAEAFGAEALNFRVQIDCSNQENWKK